MYTCVYLNAGKETLLEQSGKDSTGAFDAIGHSKSAQKIMEKYLIGEMDTSKKSNGPSASSCSMEDDYIVLVSSFVLIVVFIFGIMMGSGSVRKWNSSFNFFFFTDDIRFTPNPQDPNEKAAW